MEQTLPTLLARRIGTALAIARIGLAFLTGAEAGVDLAYAAPSPQSAAEASDCEPSAIALKGYVGQALKVDPTGDIAFYRTIDKAMGLDTGFMNQHYDTFQHSGIRSLEFT